jgi:hypothetical protein
MGQMRDGGAASYLLLRATDRQVEPCRRATALQGQEDASRSMSSMLLACRRKVARVGLGWHGLGWLDCMYGWVEHGSQRCRRLARIIGGHDPKEAAVIRVQYQYQYQYLRCAAMQCSAVQLGGSVASWDSICRVQSAECRVQHSQASQPASRCAPSTLSVDHGSMLPWVLRTCLEGGCWQ